MRLSKLFGRTLREVPADAEMVSQIRSASVSKPAAIKMWNRLLRIIRVLAPRVMCLKYRPTRPGSQSPDRPERHPPTANPVFFRNSRSFLARLIASRRFS